MLVTATLLTGCESARSRSRVGRGVQVSDISGYIGYVLRERRDNRELASGGREPRSTETIMEQSIKLDLNGYVYHPNLFEFALGGLFGLSQYEFSDNFQDRDRRDKENGSVLEFNFDGTFSRKKNHPGTVFARRFRSLEPRPFLSSIEQTTTTYGAMWQYLGEKFSTRLRYEHRLVDSDVFGEADDDRRRTNDQLRWDSRYRFNKDNNLTLTYRHQSIEEDPFENDYDVDEVIVSHRLNFGEDKQHSLNSELRYFRQDGSLNIERTLFRETLRMEHSDELSSSVQFEWIDRTQGNISGADDLKERSISLSGSLDRKFYDNLTTQLSGLVQTQEFGESAEIKRLGIHAGFDYFRDNPWGVLTINYGINLDQVDRKGDNQRIPTIDESHTFQDGRPIILLDPNIELSSIHITSQDELERFRLGDDYSVTRFANQVEIRRAPTGRIDDGEIVLIDYTTRTGSSFDLETVSQHLGVRQDLKFGLSPYYLFTSQRQRVSPSDADFTAPENLTAHLVGLEYQRGGLNASVEYEDYESSIKPFRAVRVRGAYNLRLDTGASMGLRANWSSVNFGPPNPRNTTFFTVGGRYRHPIARGLNVEASVQYRSLEDSFSGNDTGIELDLSLEYRVRETEIELTYEFRTFEDEFMESDSSMLLLQIRRRF